MSNFHICTVAEVADNFDNIRIPLSAKQRENLKKIYPYYGAQNMIDHVDNYLFDGEYILVAEDGENLKSQNSKICNLVNGKFWVNNHAHILKAKEENNTKYLYYYLNLINFRPFITGSAQPKLTKDNLSAIPLTIHFPEDQKKIASALSTIDDKIELNNKINIELEQMLKTIYDYWFVQFDFPDESGKPYKTSGGAMVYNEELKREAPKGWDVKQLNDIISRSGTGLNPRDNFELGHGDNFYITIKNVKNGKIIFDDSCDRVDDDALEIINRRSDLQIGDILFTSIEPIGVTYFVHEKPKNWNINESVFTIRANYEKVTAEYLYMLLSSLEMKEFTKNASAGSIHKGIRHNVLKTFKLPYKNKEIIEEFSKIVSPILKRIYNLDLENQKLVELRDWLLPMLMNGQVKVK